MRYRATIETDDFKEYSRSFKFFEDSIGEYLACKDAGANSDEWVPIYFTKCKDEEAVNEIPGSAIIEIAIEAFKTYEKHMWHPIKEGPPPEGKDILVTDIDGDVYATMYGVRNGVGVCYDSGGDKIKNITAWMLFPKGYESENEG